MSSSRSSSEDLIIPAVATLGFHVLLAIGLVLAGRYADHTPPVPEETEVDVEPPPPPPPQVQPRVVLPEPPPPPPPVEPPPEQPPPVVAPRVAQRDTPAPPRLPPPPDQPPPPPQEEPPAGSEGVPGGEPIVLPDVYVNGDVEVGHGTRQGTGGSGGGTGTQNAGQGGTAPPQPAPVSIAAIKKRAQPIGDVDYLSTRDYPDEARKLGLEGRVQVRLLIDATGKVTKRTLLTKLGHGLDELAMKLAATIRFEPALDANDRPVPSIVVWGFDFILPR